PDPSALSISTLSLHDALPISGRGIDDPQHLGGRGLLFQRLACLGNEPRVLHSDDRLGGEVLQQRDLVIRERSDFPAIDVEAAKRDRKSTRLNSSHRTISYAVF